MADSKISALPAATTPLAGTEVLPVVQGGATDQVSVANLTAGRDVSVKKLNATDNIVIGTAGKGIDFSANTHAPGMTSELLDWYEEGDWTPNQGAGLTVSGSFSSTGKYTRIGNQVTITGSLSGSTSIQLAAPGIIFTNIPYAAGSGSCGSMNTSSLISPGTLTVVSGTTVFGTTTTAVSTIYFAMTYFV